MLVLIIGGRYGSEKSESRTGLSRSFFERYDSITKQEYQSALLNNIPVYILVESQVYAEYHTFQKNKGNNGITYAHVDSINVFHLLEEILLQKRNNAMNTFSRYAEIEDWLREQWAGFFRELMKRTTQSQEIASLSSQVLQLSELNKTLKTYLENLMTSVSPEQSKTIILTESTRLEEVEKQSAVSDNDFFRFMQRQGLSSEMAREIIEKSSNMDDLERKLLGHENKQTILHTLKFERAQDDFNEVRRILGKRPFTFRGGNAKSVDRSDTDHSHVRERISKNGREVPAGKPVR